MVGPIEGLRVVDCSTGRPDRAPPDCSPTTAPTSCGSSRPAAIPCGGARRKPCRSSTAASAASSSISPTASAREQLLALIDRADVFVESWRPGVADRLGLGYDALHARNPALVYVSISGFGEDAGHRPARLRAHRAGRARQHVRPGRAPRRARVPRVSLRQHRRRVPGRHRRARRAPPRREDGVGRHVRDLAVRRRPRLPLDAVGRERRVARVTRRSPLGRSSRRRTTRLITRSFECADGEYLGTAHRCRRRVRPAMKVLGIDDRDAAERRRDGHRRAADRRADPDPPVELPSTSSRPGRGPSGCSGSSRPMCAWSSTCARPRCTTRRRLATTRWWSRSTIPCSGRVEQVAPPVKFSVTPGSVRVPAPMVGEHTDDVLATARRLAGTGQSRRTTAPDHPAAARRRQHPRPRRVLRRAVLVPAARRPRRRGRQGRAARRRPAPGHRATVLLGPGRQARHGRQPQGPAAASALSGGLLGLGRRRPPQPSSRCGRAAGARLSTPCARSTRTSCTCTPRAGARPVRFAHAPELRADALRVRRRHLRDRRTVQPAASAVGQRGSGQRAARRESRILLALLHRHRTGVGQSVENPQLNATMGHLGAHRPATRRQGHRGRAPRPAATRRRPVRAPLRDRRRLGVRQRRREHGAGGPPRGDGCGGCRRRQPRPGPRRPVRPPDDGAGRGGVGGRGRAGRRSGRSEQPRLHGRSAAPPERAGGRGRPPEQGERAGAGGLAARLRRRRVPAPAGSRAGSGHRRDPGSFGYGASELAELRAAGAIR